ncbi:MAG: hypothetical protein AAB676_18060 [Verrucomicrobiota bacterium]
MLSNDRLSGYHRAKDTKKEQNASDLELNDIMGAPLVAARGYDAETLAKGAALRLAAQNAYNQRQQALGDQRGASETAEKAEKEARQFYADFREIARVVFSGGADQTKLGLKGNVPAERIAKVALRGQPELLSKLKL